MSVLRGPVRLLTIAGKEIVEVIRRPGAIASLVFGPFLILGLFASGYTSARRPLDTVVVVPPASSLPTDVSAYQNRAPGVHVVAVTSDDAGAMRELRERRIDLVVVLPTDLSARLAAGTRSTIEVAYNEIDPIEATYREAAARAIVEQLNEAIITRIVQSRQASPGEIGAPALANIPPDVVAAPTRAALVNLAPVSPDLVTYFGPAVLALILQQMALTLAALSLIRERTTGLIELYRVAPVSVAVLIAGKLLAILSLNVLIAGAMTVLLVGPLGVPLVGPAATIAAVMLLLIAASIAVGLFLGAIADSESQTVQLALLVLLASVLFSGFILNVKQLLPRALVVSDLLPVTHGVQLLQDLMLRGSTAGLWHIGAIAGIGLANLILAWLVLRHRMSAVRG